MELSLPRPSARQIELQSQTFGFIEAARAAQSLKELNAAFDALMSGFGHDTWFFGGMSLSQHKIGLGYSIALGRQPQEWYQHYFSAQHLPHDRVFQMSQTNRTAFSWRQAAEERPMTAREAIVFDEAREFGMPNGVCVPLPAINGANWLVTTAWRHGELEAGVLEATEMAAHYFASRAIWLGRFDLGNASGRRADLVLSVRERDVLTKLAAGHTQAQIARLIGVSVKRVEAIMAEARGKLDARTTAQLLSKAILQGEIDLGAAIRTRPVFRHID